MAMGKTWRWRGRCVLLLALAAGGWLAAEAQAQGFSWPEGRKAAVSLSYDDALDSQLDNAIPALDRQRISRRERQQQYAQHTPWPRCFHRHPSSGPAYRVPPPAWRDGAPATARARRYDLSWPRC